MQKLVSINYSTVEAALVSTLIADISLFTANNMKAGNFDDVFLYALSDNDVYVFSWTDMGPGSNQGRGIWQHTVMLNVGILFRDQDTGADSGPQMETDLRTVRTAMEAEMIPENTLDGAVISARLDSIELPELWKNIDTDVNYVRLGFNIVIDQQIDRC